MSMYTQLLHAAVGARAAVRVHPTKGSAVNALDRCRRELAKDAPAGAAVDAVPVVLAREVAYDVALLDLATVIGIATDLERFAQPRLERARLERALRDRGMMLPGTGGTALGSPTA
jgi:hypothetical protein